MCIHLVVHMSWKTTTQHLDIELVAKKNGSKEIETKKIEYEVV